ncbi:hypothetical protein F5Y18DRAFT_416903 [Xylariaceae sp. FL1019]|nr:hypothetical protein F5Y18DRAFT_416903 [Xylariaceae sp. FL1019]
MSPSSSFSMFALLPAELRLQIWREACVPRVVPLTYDPNHDRCTSPARVPAVLQTCHESRAESLLVYQKTFGTRSHEPRTCPNFCLKFDILYIPRPPCMGYENSTRSFVDNVTGISHVVYLGLDLVPPAIRRPWETYNKYVLVRSLAEVHEVSLVIDAAIFAETPFVRAQPRPDLENLSINELVERTYASFLYEVGHPLGERLGIVGKEAHAVEPLSIPSLVLRSKAWLADPFAKTP